RREGQWDLLMGPVHIQRLAYRPGEQGLTAPDSLSDYYLDIDNLFNTSEEEVDAWLDDFWARYLANDEKQAALDVLGLSEPLNKKHVERRYRQLAMQHHPDRGGDAERLVEINHAVAVLRKLL
ncbi:MAG: DnaJ domain-containing protein, partial [Gammaproteobacteria bacterium]|nr:DnaJ domain-containing protein [Gammaproteobacteria bacterium]